MTKRYQPRGSANFPGGVTTGSLGNASAANALTATAGGGQTNALLLAAKYNRLTTVATAADSVKLPPGKAGNALTLINSGANSAQVFGSGTETINGVATATGVALAATKVAEFICPADGLWFMNLTA